MASQAYFDHLRGKTIAAVDYMSPDSAGNTNGMNETITFKFTDGTEFSVWSYGYSLDSAHNPSR